MRPQTTFQCVTYIDAVSSASKPHNQIFATQVYFGQSRLSLDINTLITTSPHVLVVQRTGPCQINLGENSVPYKRFSRFQTVFR